MNGSESPLKEKYRCIRPETIKLLEENVRGKLLDNDFIEMTPKAQATKTKLNKWDYIKVKIFRTAKEMISRMKGQPMGREKILSNHISDKR